VKPLCNASTQIPAFAGGSPDVPSEHRKSGGTAQTQPNLRGPRPSVTSVRCLFRRSHPARGSLTFRQLTSAAFRTCLILAAIPFLESCASSHRWVPSIDVFGSYFPAWLISLFIGVVLTVVASSAARLIEIRPSGLLGLLVCVSLLLIFSTAVWFSFFAS
jgi:hypothetical protein